MLSLISSSLARLVGLTEYYQCFCGDLSKPFKQSSSRGSRAEEVPSLTYLLLYWFGIGVSLSLQLYQGTPRSLC